MAVAWGLGCSSPVPSAGSGGAWPSDGFGSSLDGVGQVYDTKGGVSDGKGQSDGVGDGSLDVDVDSGPIDNDTGIDPTDTSDFCPDHQIICDGTTAKTCDGKGGYLLTKDCAGACIDLIGCVVCQPGSGQCDGDKPKKCLEDGSGWTVSDACDPELGLTCDPGSGACKGPCSTKDMQRSYIGCEYWPTVTSNSNLYSGFSFAVVIANTSQDTATVTISRDASFAKITVDVPANAVQTVKLPWVADLKHDASGASGGAQLDQLLPSNLVASGAYRLKSTRPVTVYQFNPLEFEIPYDFSCPDSMGVGTCNSYTNDASMLLPTNAMGKQYIVASMPEGAYQDGLGGSSAPGFVTIVGTQNGTKVHIDSTAHVRSGPGVQEIQPGKGADFVLNAGDALQLLTKSVTSGEMLNCTTLSPSATVACAVPKTYDLTGSQITASAPVSVIGGHDCVMVPYGKFACDHVEETLFPLNSWGDTVLVTPPQSVIGAKVASGGADQHLVRIISGMDGNVITFDPPNLPALNLDLGAWADLPLTKDSLQVTGTGPILVAQIMAGGDVVDPQDSGSPNSKGDPSLSLAVPSSQYRKEYVFLTPSSYTYSFVNIIAKQGTTVNLDGAPVTKNFAPIGSTGYAVARVPVAGGSHTTDSDTAFGIVVYGYGAYTSYMYPGGLNLTVNAGSAP